MSKNLNKRVSVLMVAVALGCSQSPIGKSDPGDSGTRDSETGKGAWTDMTVQQDSEYPVDSDSDKETSKQDSGLIDGGESDSEQDGTYLLDGVLRLNHVQVKGTHNSYHREPAIPFDDSHRYSHLPIGEQLESLGVRAFELDIHLPVMKETFEVYHIFGIDAKSTCFQLEDCLLEMKKWSDAHRNHLPIFVWFECKDATGGRPINDMGKLEKAVLEVFSKDRIITPDRVQGTYATLKEAVVERGWPTLGELRGMMIFMILGEDKHIESYTDGFKTLEGRIMFARAKPEHFDKPWAAVTKDLNPGTQELSDAIHKNMLVGSNICSAGESDDHCFSELEKALGSGLNMLMDDFPGPQTNRSYWMEFTDGQPARCNPVTAPEICTSGALESL